MEKSKQEPVDVKGSKSEIFKALLQEPTTYHIEVVNNSGLPDSVKGKKEISFEIKPPVMSTLAKIGKIVNDLPDDVFDLKASNAHLLKYAPQMCEIVAVLSHGNSKKKMPDWYIDFLMNNLTPDETLMIFQESTMKLKTDFFLPCFQTARVNPMMMEKMTVTTRKRKSASTRSSK